MAKEKRGGYRTPGPGKRLGAQKKEKTATRGASIACLPLDLHKAFKKHCKDNGRTMNWAIIDMVTKYIAEN